MRPAAPVGGRRGKQLRSAVRTVRERRPAPHGRAGDPELVALVEEPYSSVEETHRRLESLLSAYEARDDRRAVFLSIYVRMTGAVARRLRGDEFEDPEWVGEYLVAFANLYRAAVHDYETGALDSLADPWQLAFEAAERGDSLVLQDAMLGVNAHINYDLSLAVHDADVRPDPDAKYADHSRITDVIAAILDESQDGLVERGADGLGTLDDSLGRLDEWLSVLTIDECRDSAWRTAIALNSRLGPRRRLARWINDVTSTGAAYLILSSKTSDLVHEALRDLEGTSEGWN